MNSFKDVSSVSHENELLCFYFFLFLHFDIVLMTAFDQVNN